MMQPLTELANKHRELPNRPQLKAFKSEHGLRYSKLLQFPNFDVLCYCVVNPMHNLLEALSVVGWTLKGTDTVTLVNNQS